MEQKEDGCLIWFLITTIAIIFINYYKFILITLAITIVILIIGYVIYNQTLFNSKKLKYDLEKNICYFENKFIKIKYTLKNSVMSIHYYLKWENFPNLKKYKTLKDEKLLELYNTHEKTDYIYLKLSKKIFKITKKRYEEKIGKPYNYQSLAPYNRIDSMIQAKEEKAIQEKVKLDKNKSEFISPELHFERYQDYAIISYKNLAKCHINLLSPYNINLLYVNSDGTIISKTIKSHEIVDKIKDVNENDVNQIVKIANLIIDLAL